MVTAEMLEQTFDWMHDFLLILDTANQNHMTSGCDVTPEALNSLESSRSELARHIRRIEDGARKKNWSTQESRSSYLDEVENSKQVLLDAIDKTIEEQELPEKRYDSLRSAAHNLEDCAAGLCEEL